MKTWNVLGNIKSDLGRCKWLVKRKKKCKTGSYEKGSSINMVNVNEYKQYEVQKGKN